MSIMGKNNDILPTYKSIEKTSLSKPFRQLWDGVGNKIGDSILLPLEQKGFVQIDCTKRCLRLAFKHILQQLPKSGISCGTVQGFLFGSCYVEKDHQKVCVCLDHFDPGMITDQNIKIPSAVFPDAIVVPIQLTAHGFGAHRETCRYCAQQFASIIKGLQETGKSLSSLSISKFFLLRLYFAYTDEMMSQTHLSDINLHWSVVFIKAPIKITPVEAVPLIPTALAKSLRKLHHWSQEQSVKTGFVSMDQMGKLLLLLDTDPKVAQIQTVGVWINSQDDLFHPLVHLACLRYANCDLLRKRPFTDDGQFLLLVFSIKDSKPLFYKCLLNQMNYEDFDMAYTNESFSLSERFNSAQNTVTLLLNSASSKNTLERDMFDSALKQRAVQVSQRKDMNGCHHDINTTLVPICDASSDIDVVTETESNIYPSPSLQPINATPVMLIDPSMAEPSMMLDETLEYRFKSNNAIVLKNKTSLELNADNNLLLQQDTLSNTLKAKHVTLDTPHAPLIFHSKGIVNSTLGISSTENSTSVLTSAIDIPISSVDNRLHFTQDVTPHEQKCSKKFLSNATETSASIKDFNAENGDLHTSKASFLENGLKNSNVLPSPVKSMSSEYVGSNSLIHSSSFMQNLSPEVYHLYLHQETQLKQLKEQIKQLLAVQDNLSRNTRCDASHSCNVKLCTNKQNAETQTNLLVEEKVQNCARFQSIGINTSLNEISNPSNAYENGNYSHDSSIEKNDMLVPDLNAKAESGLHSETTQGTKAASLNFSDNAGKSFCWDFDSSNLTLPALKLSNNDISIASSLKEVDIPRLDISGENITSNTPSWRQQSPVLGESASMYLCNQSPFEDGLRKGNLDEDDRFFGDVIKQVKDMLKNDGIETKDRCTMPHSFVHCKSIPEDLLPNLTCLGMLANHGILEPDDIVALVGCHTTDELSLHANGIALKYLSDDQLNNITSSNMNWDSLQFEKTFPCVNDSGAVKSARSNIPGMNLLSPCYMSLATKKYMQKYGLVEKLAESNHENRNPGRPTDALEVQPSTLDSENDSANQGCRLNSTNIIDDRLNDILIRTKELEQLSNKRNTNTSPLQETLGDTLEKLHPILENFERDKLIINSIDGYNKQRIGESTQHDSKKVHISNNHRDMDECYPLDGEGKVIVLEAKAKRDERISLTTNVLSKHTKRENNQISLNHFTCSDERNKFSLGPNIEEKEGLSFERILDSRVMQAFKQHDAECKHVLSREDKKRIELSKFDAKTREGENILNLSKIHSLPKLT